MQIDRYVENHWEETIAAYRKQMEKEAALREKYLQEDLPMYEDERGLEREENN
jgi:hypothetical protein